MTAKNPFIYETAHYKRDYNNVENYIRDVSHYLSTMTNKPMDVCDAYVRKNITADGKYPIKNPRVRFLERNNVGDREVKEDTYFGYMEKTHQQRLILAPTFTAYLHPEDKESLLGKYIQKNLKKRKGFKHKMFEATMQGNKSAELYYDNLQNSSKIKNNSLSGAHSSPYTVLYNKTTHSSLTSTCRVTTSIGNANNEKFIAGNRHYWQYHIAIQDILTITRNTDYTALQLAIDTYGLIYPTTQQVMDCITRSSIYYWSNSVEMEKIVTLVDRLKPIERAAFLYVGDFYHLAQCNPDAVRGFLTEMIQIQKDSLPLEEADKWLSSLSGDAKVFVNLQSVEWTKGILLSDLKVKDPVGYGCVGANAKYMADMLNKHRILIEGVMRPPTLPTSIATFPNIMRRAVIASDTDSTIFTTQYWTKWFKHGVLDFSQESVSVGTTICFLTSQIVVHLLAMMTANIGMRKEHLHLLEMKNEFFFPTFSLTTRAKHYFATIGAREGNVFAELKQEVKGVELRSSNAPPAVMNKLKAWMLALQTKVMNEGTLLIADALGPVAAIEHEIINDIKNGGNAFLRSVPVKDASSYANGDDAPAMVHHQMWEQVWAPKYGNSAPPPYQGVKVNVGLDSPTKLKAFLNSIEDKALADRLRTFLNEKGRDKIEVLTFPKPMIEMVGIPKEIIPVIELRKLIYAIMAPFYLTLESFGLYMVNDHNTRLISDTWPATAA